MFSLIWWLLVILGCGMLAPAIVMWGGLLFMFATAPVRAVKFVVHRLGNHAEPAPINARGVVRSSATSTARPSSPVAVAFAGAHGDQAFAGGEPDVVEVQRDGFADPQPDVERQQRQHAVAGVQRALGGAQPARRVAAGEGAGCALGELEAARRRRAEPLGGCRSRSARRA